VGDGICDGGGVSDVDGIVNSISSLSVTTTTSQQ